MIEAEPRKLLENAEGLAWVPVGFDLDRLQVRDMPAPVLEDVAGNADEGAGQYDVARNGTLVYLSGKSSNTGRPVAWMDTVKTTLLLAAPGQYYYSPHASPGNYGFPRVSRDGKLVAYPPSTSQTGDVHVWEVFRAENCSNGPRPGGGSPNPTAFPIL